MIKTQVFVLLYLNAFTQSLWYATLFSIKVNMVVCW